MNDDDLFCLVLAAGRSRRFGAPKQLAGFRGRTLLSHSLHLAATCCPRRTVLVLGAHWREVLDRHLPLDAFVVLNTRFARGIASSIAAGLAVLPPDAGGVLILLGDQPLITASHVDALRDAARGGRIAATAYGGVTGVPALFPARSFGALSGLQGDQGARALLEGDATIVRRVPFADAAVDIDTVDDLAGLH
jgi:molybdenum cofactor cytidylyltransferase